MPPADAIPSARPSERKSALVISRRCVMSGERNARTGNRDGNRKFRSLGTRYRAARSRRACSRRDGAIADASCRHAGRRGREREAAMSR